MMQLVPLRVTYPPETRVTFTCSYRSNERLAIEFQAISESESKFGSTQLGLLSDYVARYSWGAQRKWTIVLKNHHRLVACRVRNHEGTVVGQLHAVVSPGATVANYSVAN